MFNYSCHTVLTIREFPRELASGGPNVISYFVEACKTSENIVTILKWYWYQSRLPDPTTRELYTFVRRTHATQNSHFNCGTEIAGSGLFSACKECVWLKDCSKSNWPPPIYSRYRNLARFSSDENFNEVTLTLFSCWNPRLPCYEFKRLFWLSVLKLYR